VCNLCHGIVRFIAANDPAGRFAFLPLSSPRARALLAAHQPANPAKAGNGAPEPDTVILLQNGHRYELSDAALHVALGLRAPWPLAFALILVPRAARDAVYRWIARNRYAWFGRKDVCPVPPPGLRDRFLDPSTSAGQAAPQ
jgi:predicted DCC family thiol-disulfide oxidoreductase YuxK